MSNRYPIQKNTGQGKVPTGEMKDVDVKYVSLVSKAANKQKFQIFKSEDADEPVATENNNELETDEQQQAVGLLQTIKKFFQGDLEKSGEVASANKADDEEDTPPTFGQAIQMQEARSQMWRSFDTMESVFWQLLRSKADNKRELLTSSLAEFTTKVLEGFDKLNKTPISKEDGEEHDIEKAGKKISAKRLKVIEEARDYLNSIIEEATGNNDKGQQAAADIKKEEEIDMKAEDMEKIVKSAIGEAVKPLNERMDKIEKGEEQDGGEGNDNGNGEGQGADVNKQDQEPKIEDIVKNAVSEATKPLNERMDKIEKARGVSNQVREGEGEGESQHDVEKSGGKWGGLFTP